MLMASTEGFRLKMTEEVLLFGLVVDRNWLAVILVDLIMHYKTSWHYFAVKLCWLEACCRKNTKVLTAYHPVNSNNHFSFHISISTCMV